MQWAFLALLILITACQLAILGHVVEIRKNGEKPSDARSAFWTEDIPATGTQVIHTDGFPDEYVPPSTSLHNPTQRAD